MGYFLLGFLTCLVIIALIVYLFYKKKLSSYNNFFEASFGSLDFMKGDDKDE